MRSQTIGFRPIFMRKMCIKTTTPKEFNKLDKIICGAASIGGVTGGILFGYNSFTKQKMYGDFYYREAVFDVTFHTIMGVYIGAICVLLSPIVLPIASIVSISLYMKTQKEREP